MIRNFYALIGDPEFSNSLMNVEKGLVNNLSAKKLSADMRPPEW
ncbi:MAG: hypothetical protein JWP71_2925 [Mucilaginibacter sp.]|nr:hypothetical protein [Mucilaginibacter sp.]